MEKGSLQTHDALGRVFVDPIPGGPVDDKTNVVFCSTCMGGKTLLIQKDDESAEYILGECDENGEYEDVDVPYDEVQKAIGGLDSDANVPYSDGGVSFVSDLPFKEVKDLVEGVLDEYGIDYEELR
jgi:hypothetical protein